MAKGPQFTSLTDMLTDCHRVTPRLSHGIAVCPTCGAVVAGIAYAGSDDDA
jgi:ribosomal protein L37AE/L43A